MANAFQDQLLKAGLASKDKLNKINKTKHKQAKQQNKNAATEADVVKQQVKQAALEKAERDRELNRLKQEEENKKAITAQIRQLIEMNRLSSRDGEITYNFEDDNKIKHLYVSEEQRQQIISGRLVIVRLDAGYEIIPKSVAEKIIQRDADIVVVMNEKTQSSDEDDEYADFKVPDDLMW